MEASKPSDITRSKKGGTEKTSIGKAGRQTEGDDESEDLVRKLLDLYDIDTPRKNVDMSEGSKDHPLEKDV